MSQKQKKYIPPVPEEIKKNLRHGDVRRIALAMGLSMTHISNILNGKACDARGVLQLAEQLGQKNRQKIDELIAE